MILSLTINNFMAFSNEVSLSFLADMRSPHFKENVFTLSKYNVVKSSCVYGPNNVGKTCLGYALRFIKEISKGKEPVYSLHKYKNLFTEDKEIALGISFLYKDKAYSLSFKYIEPESENESSLFTYEKFSELPLSGEKEKIIYERDMEKNKCHYPASKEVEKALNSAERNKLSLYSIRSDIAPNSYISYYRDILTGFSDSLEIINAPEAKLNKTINELKKGEGGHGKEITSLISLADLDITDYIYDERRDNPILDKVRENLNVSEASKSNDDLYRLFSVHNGKEIESILYDSKGTRMIVSLAGYIVDALYNDKTLVIDELDSGLHSSLSRALVALFNSETNSGAQLLFMSHDMALLNTRDIFRKDQIYFLDRERKEDESSSLPFHYLYRLDKFTASGNGIRPMSNASEKYLEGYFGALPSPDFFSLMLDIAHKEK